MKFPGSVKETKQPKFKKWFAFYNMNPQTFLQSILKDLHNTKQTWFGKFSFVDQCALE